MKYMVWVIEKNLVDKNKKMQVMDKGQKGESTKARISNT